MQQNNYIGQMLVEEIENIRHEQRKDKEKGVFDIQKSKTKILGLNSLINLETLKFQVELKNNVRKIELTNYDGKVFEYRPEHKQLENHPETPLQSKDFIVAQIEQYKRTITGDDSERMPGPDELTNAGYGKLVELIDNSGGFAKWAEILGLKYQE